MYKTINTQARLFYSTRNRISCADPQKLRFENQQKKHQPKIKSYLITISNETSKSVSQPIKILNWFMVNIVGDFITNYSITIETVHSRILLLPALPVT
jgi:hypothetical protein